MLACDETDGARIYKWLLVGALLPVCAGLVDQWLLHLWLANSGWQSGGLPTLLILAVFVLQIGLLGVAAGRWVEWAPLRWVIYGWCWLVVDMQLLALVPSAVSRLSHWLVVDSMFAAQIGLATIWAILGVWRWPLRIPLALALIAFLATPLAAQGFRQLNEMHVVVQTLALAVVCLALRLMGLRFVPGNGEAGGAQVPPRPLVQFGVRHVLMWMTSLALALGVARGLDLLRWDTLTSMLGRGWLGALTLSILMAMVLVTALWSALGHGCAWLRWPFLACLMAAVSTVGAIPAFRARLKPWGLDPWHLAASFLFAGALCAASLLIFRVRGYRLAAINRQ